MQTFIAPESTLNKLLFDKNENDYQKTTKLALAFEPNNVTSSHRSKEQSLEEHQVDNEEIQQKNHYLQQHPLNLFFNT